MDEMGHQDWADAKDCIVYVPAEEERKVIPLPVLRGGKRLTLVGAIAADGSSLTPMIIITRHTIDQDLQLFGIRDSTCMIAYQENGFITQELFADWFSVLFLPEIQQRRECTGYEGPCILIMDGCSCHDGDIFLDLAMEENIIPLYIPPHSSNQLQPCDLCLFGLTKRQIIRINKLPEGNAQSLHIAKVICGYLIAATPINVVQSFRNAGISLRLDGVILKAEVSIESCRCLMFGPSIYQTCSDEEEEVKSSTDVDEIPEFLQILDEEAALFLREELKTVKKLTRFQPKKKKIHPETPD
jgi:hypothetical protein